MTKLMKVKTVINISRGKKILTIWFDWPCKY